MSAQYRHNVLKALESALPEPIDTGLDLGSGDGFFAARLMEHGKIKRVTALEVQERANSEIKPALYDGVTIPYAERSFDIVYAIDTIHHARDPAGTLVQLARCSDKWLLLKDHTYRNMLEFSMLCVMDELGNRRFGVPSIYKYQRGFSWFEIIAAAGFTLVQLTHPATCEHGLLGRVTNPLHFVALWRRNAA
jgi:SAM-dependent methyltransferase